MKYSYGALGAALLLASGSVVAKDVTYHSAELGIAQALAPDVSDWRWITEGLSVGNAKDGSFVRIYYGASGARLALLDDEARYEQQISLLALLESTAKSANDVEALLDQQKAAADMLAALEMQRGAVSALETEATSAAKAQQIYPFPGGTLCGVIPYGQAVFSANVGIPRFSTATAGLEPFGSPPQFGSPPGPPYYLARIVQAQRSTPFDAPVTDTEFVTDSTLNMSASVTGSSNQGDCTLVTYQSHQARCASTSPVQTFRVTRTQSCVGVLAGTPPSSIITTP